MMLLFQAMCLCITLIVLQTYIVKEVYSRAHRLLPLVLGLIGVFNFYQLLQTVTGQRELFSKMRELLMVQMVYLLLYYLLDVLQMKLPRFVGLLLFFVLIGTNMSVFLCYDNNSVYYRQVGAFVFSFLIIIMLVGTYTYLKFSYTKREHFVSSMLYLSFLIPGVVICICRILLLPSDIWITGSLACTCAIIFYLMQTRKLDDVELLLQKQMYIESEEPMVLYDPDYYYVAANVAAKKLFPEELKRRLRSRDKSKYQERVKDILDGVENAEEVCFDGRHFRCSVSPVVIDEKVAGYALSMLDITEEVLKIQEMTQLKERAEELAEHKGKYLARISHDLRSPLYAIVGISDILLGEKRIPDSKKPMIHHLKSAGNTLLERVNSILSISKLEAGKLELAHQPYQLETLIREVANVCILNLRSKPVDFIVSFVTEYPAEVIGDELQVKEILQNVLSNAVKYTKKGKILCEITCKKQENGDGMWLTFCVQDTGCGMTEEQLAGLFDEYVSYARQSEEGGSGLGMSIVKQLVELMDGYVTVESDGKSGTVVTMTIYQNIGETTMEPPVYFDREMLMWHGVKKLETVQPSYLYPGAKVLFADDMRVNQDIFRELVRPWQFELVTVSSGREAILAAQTEEFQIIFLDQMMPQMTGTETAKRIAKICNTPMIMLTADLSDETRENCNRYGFADFLSKPIELGLLQQVIEKYIPEHFRQKSGKIIQSNSLYFETKKEFYRQILNDYVDEITKLLEDADICKKENLGLLGIKVHGIKGVAKQLDKMEISESAEILEMAAKTGNYPFIETHWEDFKEELLEDLAFSKRELSMMPQQEQTQIENATENVKEKLFAKLRDAFRDYQITQIENYVKQLEGMELPEESAQLLVQVKKAADNLEYEAGYQLLGGQLDDDSKNFEE